MLLFLIPALVAPPPMTMPPTSFRTSRGRSGIVSRGLSFLLLLPLLSACALFHKKPPAPQPVPPPAPEKIAVAPVEPPPVPLRKPPPPHVAPPAAPAPPQVAVLPTPIPPPPEPVVAPPIVGLDPTALQKALGAPDTRLDAPPAVIWEYEEGACTIDVYLYDDLKTGIAHALYVAVKGDDRGDERRQACLNIFAQRAAHYQADNG